MGMEAESSGMITPTPTAAAAAIIIASHQQQQQCSRVEQQAGQCCVTFYGHSRVTHWVAAALLARTHSSGTLKLSQGSAPLRGANNKFPNALLTATRFAREK